MVKERFSVKTLVIAMAVLFSLSLIATGCGDSKSTSGNEVYKIGAVLSVSGPAAPLGQPEQRALTLLESEINADGGIDGHKVKFIVEDDGSDPTKAQAAITKLIKQEKVAAVVGTSTTGGTLAMAPVANAEKVPMVCCAAGTKITDPITKYVYRTPPTDSMAIQKVLEYLKKNKITKIAIIHDSNAFGVGGADELTAKAPKYGIEILARESYGSTDTDMTGQLTKIKQTDAQTLVNWGTNPGPASIAKNMKQLGMTIPYVCSHGIASKKFIELAGDAANGVVFPAGKLLLPSTITDSDWKKAVDDFSAAYKKKFNLEIDTYAAHGYDAGLIITNAMKTAGNDPLELNQEIEKTKGLVGIDGIFNYSAKDHNGLSAEDMTMILIENGKWTAAK